MVSLLRGFLVSIETCDDPRSRTDTYVYLGLAGRHGGGEFALDSIEEDFARGTVTTLRAGDLPPPESSAFWSIPADVRPIRDDRESNHPVTRGIDLDALDHVYLRKSSVPLRYRYRKQAGALMNVADDDDWKIGRVSVLLFGTEAGHEADYCSGRYTSRAFHRSGDLWLGTPHGMQVLIPPAWESALGIPPDSSGVDDDRFRLG
jgi:hypothetical protein